MKKLAVLFIGNYFNISKSNPNIWEDLHFRFKQIGWNILRVSEKPGKIARLFDVVYTIVRKRNNYKFAEIDVFSGKAFILAEISSYILSILSKPYLLTLHGGNLPAFAKNHPNRMKHLLTSAVKVITPSLYLQNTLQEYRDDIVVIPNPIPINNYDYKQRTEVRPNIIWLRAFHEIYNPELAPKVLQKVLKEFPAAKLTMIGPDKQDGSLEKTRKLAEDLGVSPQTQFVGQIPKNDVPVWLNKGDIFINTTNVDNTPISVLEAMACGLCIVSTDVGGLPFLLDDNVNALLVSRNDSDAMASCILRFLRDSALSARLSSNARKKAEMFSLQKVLPLWEKEFEKLL